MAWSTGCSQNSPLDRPYSKETVSQDLEDIKEVDAESEKALRAILILKSFAGQQIESQDEKGQTYREILVEFKEDVEAFREARGLNDKATNVSLYDLELEILDIAYTDWEGKPTKKPRVKLKIRNQGERPVGYMQSRITVAHSSTMGEVGYAGIMWPTMKRMTEYKINKNERDLLLKPGEEATLYTTPLNGNYEVSRENPTDWSIDDLFICMWEINTLSYDDRKSVNIDPTLARQTAVGGCKY